MENSKLSSAVEYCKMEYDKALDTSLKLEQAKLAYQRYFISLVVAVGTISITFLKSEFFKDNHNYTIENLIGLFLMFSTILGYIILRNLVSIRRQSIWFNNAIIYIRGRIINNLELSEEFPKLKEVSANDKHSADYITILLCSLINLIMWVSSFILLIGTDKIGAIPLALSITVVVLIYVFLHYFTIEKMLITKLNNTK